MANNIRKFRCDYPKNIETSKMQSLWVKSVIGVEQFKTFKHETFQINIIFANQDILINRGSSDFENIQTLKIMNNL